MKVAFYVGGLAIAFILGWTASVFHPNIALIASTASKMFEEENLTCEKNENSTAVKASNVANEERYGYAPAAYFIAIGRFCEIGDKIVLTLDEVVIQNYQEKDIGYVTRIGVSLERTVAGSSWWEPDRSVIDSFYGIEVKERVPAKRSSAEFRDLVFLFPSKDLVRGRKYSPMVRIMLNHNQPLMGPDDSAVYWKY